MMAVTTSPGHYSAGEAALSAVNSNTPAVFHAPIVYFGTVLRVRADKRWGKQDNQNKMVNVIPVTPAGT